MQRVLRPIRSSTRALSNKRIAPSVFRAQPLLSSFAVSPRAFQPAPASSGFQFNYIPQRYFSTEKEPVERNDNIRNIAIIAHVDAGKTTLVDCLLRQSGTLGKYAGERVMDSNTLEKERGITILSKWTAVNWEGRVVNILDTPGHADFGGEVERIMTMVDGVCLLVDATEGVMPQTKFVLSKALAANLRPIVILNKVDRESSRITEVQNEIFDLFISLHANDDQLDFPIVYASAREGWCVKNPEQIANKGTNMQPLFEEIVRHIPAPVAKSDAPFSLMCTNLEHNDFLGRILTGRITSGKIKIGDRLHSLSPTTKERVEEGRVLKLLSRRGLDVLPVESAVAGDVISIAGFQKTGISDTICSYEIVQPLFAPELDPPIVSVGFSCNDSPLAGEEGTAVNALKMRDRLYKESEINVALKIEESNAKDGSFQVKGRGELQIGVLIEQMRREGFELTVSPPKILYQKDENGTIMEPIEYVTIDVDEEFAGVVIEKMSLRKADMVEYRQAPGGKIRVEFLAPARGLIGFRSEFKTETRGTGVLNHVFSSYDPFKGKLESYRRGVLVATEPGVATAYALGPLEERGVLFITPGMKVYTGMIVGEHTRDKDLEVNPTRSKQLSNMRAAGKDEAVRLSPPRLIDLEDAMAYIQEDELLEVTPKSVRLRKKILDPVERKRYSRKVDIDV